MILPNDIYLCRPELLKDVDFDSNCNGIWVSDMKHEPFWAYLYFYHHALMFPAWHPLWRGDLFHNSSFPELHKIVTVLVLPLAPDLAMKGILKSVSCACGSDNPAK